MALLCNLQADGPLTLRRLRERGCRTPDELRTLPIFELAQALGADVAFARRFLREAEALQTRLGAEAGGLEPEEPGSAGAARAAAPAPRAKRLPGEPLRAPIVASTGAPAAVPARPAAAAPGAAELEGALRARPSASHALRPGLLEGLDEEWCRALVGQGVLGLEALRDAPALALARALGRPLTKLVELQCFARRALTELAPPAPEARPERALEAAPPRRPVLEPDYTIFPPAAPRRTGPSAEPPRAPRETTRAEALETESGIGGPFA